ncbi:MULTISPECIES: decarboxylating NADP(+)-dependent phosphogluconate dehydrogenase [Porphyromonas]|uniref:6-phosphogluconate dehydrogenase, decarboxylating n=1 Tax=Porphyromonas canoris TaxID=36875 RepID=A0ABR4XMJ9_9PORP|nr:MULTISPECIES: decarboxylating NADP(+)-dependent phosphogluconate dehydrogenase [Porphyromonas]KGL53925.1 6-phosphogluconate dehydrogenase [Porphyromonas canoris]KGN67445.1 6-phosphogluconate dehydrogenase [Porphyromonas sp. COT-108 OH1349]KGN92180.1 6-phosphogluconate dehydrogenase [Porphyromonas canoris]KGN96666.1 6-phosphogluconate dehydrogenase [Porphyromonas sp. COT-108 OH2963]
MNSNLSNIGLIGLAVMGENLALNIERNGYRVSVYNRSGETVDRFINGRAKGKNFQGFKNIEEFVASIERPRKIILMIKAGGPVDAVIQQLLPYLEKGDIIMDGGNSNYTDSERRVEELYERGIYFVGSGISGGEEGALNGPSIMPGGAAEAKEHILPILEKISAKAKDGTPCCAWIGGGGAGHFVKMVHNGIEYGDMQIISEAYFIMKKLLNYSNDRMADIFGEWNKGKLESYLVEITEQILRFRDKDGNHLIDYILDAAGQKGTGKWSVINSLEFGIPLNLISTAVYERSLSALKDLREKAAALYNPFLVPEPFKGSGNPEHKIENAMYASKLVSYAQGFQLIKAASNEHNWGIDLAAVARIWRGGCIIRSAFLGEISNALTRNPDLENLLLDEFFKKEIEQALDDWREVVSVCIISGLPIPACSSSINYFHSLTTKVLPANMLQAQRDFFGAHTFERTDRPRGEFYHENWTGEGGTTASTVYAV